MNAVVRPLRPVLLALAILLVGGLLVFVPGVNEPASAAPTAKSCARKGAYLAEYFKGGKHRGKPVKVRCQKQVNATAGGKKQAVRWTKSVRLKGSYDFRVRTNGNAKVFVDGKRVATSKKGRYASGTRKLRKGMHTIQVRYVKKRGSGFVRAEYVKAPDKKKPSAPTRLRAVSGDRAVALTWTASKAMDVRGYRVYRDGRLVRTVATPRFTDTRLVNGRTYKYAVSAIDHRNNQSKRRPSVRATPKDRVAPKAPAGFAAAAGDGEVSLSWKKSTAADLAHYVLRRTGGGEGAKTWKPTKAATSYVDKSVANGINYVYALRAVDTSGNSSAAALDAAQPGDASAPAAPTELVATAGDGEVDLMWKANTESDLDGYRVYRSQSADVPTVGDGIAGLLSDPKFTDTSATNGTTYYYAVVAIDQAGNVSPATISGETTPNDVTPPAVPQDVTATSGDGSVELTWTANTDDTLSYTVRRAVGDGAFEIVATPAAQATSWIDHDVTSKTTYRYTVSATDGAGNESSPSQPAETMLPDVDAPAAPAGLTANAGDGEVSLTWIANTEDDLDAYLLHRSVDGAPSEVVAELDAEATGYTDADVDNGTEYRYFLTAVDEDGNRSAPSPTVSATPSDDSAPAVPTGLTATAGDGQVALTWAANEEDDLAGYEIVRTGGSGSVSFDVDADATTYVDDTAENGTTYAYAIQAFDEAGNTLGLSSPQSATPSDTTPPAVPAGLAATAGDSEVELTWDAVDDADLASYTLYRATGAGALEPLTTLDAGTTSYVDQTVENNTLYRYAIAAVDGAANSSAMSDEVTAAPADTTPPAAPTGLTATAGDGEVALTWAASTEPDVAGYRVYRSETADVPTSGDGIAGLLPTPAYTDENVTNGDTYSYAVVAVDEAGNVSDASETTSATPVDATAPAAPSGLVATVSEGQVSLDWDDNAESDLDHYLVLRSEVAGDEEEIAQVDESAYDDTTVAVGTTYTYRIVAVDATGNASEPSTSVEATTPAPEPEPVHEKFVFQNAAGPGVGGYTKHLGTAWTDAAGNGFVREDSLDDATHVPLDMTTNTRFRDRATPITALQNSLIHLQYGTSTPPLQPNQNTASGAFELAVPDGWYAVKVSVGDQGGGANGWDSQHTINVEGETAIDAFQGTAAKEYETATEVVEVTDGRLTVDAVGGTNTKLNSLEVDSTEAPDRTAPGAPTGLAAEVAEGEVSLAWDANDEDDLAGYRVYRSTSADVPITGAGIAGLLTEPSYVDTAVSGGTTYHYVVVAVDDAGNTSEASAPVEATPPAAPSIEEKYVFTAPTDNAVPNGWTKNDGTAWTDAAGIGWVTQASLSQATHVPLDLTKNGRARNRPAPITALQNRLMHLQYGDVADANPANGTLTAGAFERSVPDGWYEVTVSVGDQSGGPGYDSLHVVRAEGTTIVGGFQGTAAKEYDVATGIVHVTDGRLTVDAIGGTNTKINHLTIESTEAPTEPELHHKVRFADEASAPPAGYLKDFGQAYGPRTGADQGAGLSYGWMKLGTTDPQSIVGNGRNRVSDGTAPGGTPQLRAGTIHMQLPDNAASGVKVPAYWEMAVPDGAYRVEVSVGDAGTAVDSAHWLNIEGQNAIADSVPSGPAGSLTKHATAARTVVVSDGRLTLTPDRGTNTKINWVTVDSVAGSSLRPSVLKTTPANLATAVSPTGSVVSDLRLVGSGVEPTSLQGNVRLVKVAGGSAVTGSALTSGGADTINFSPTGSLDDNTTYRLEITDGVKDVDGRAFLPYSIVFTTGETATPGGPVAFDKSDSGAPAGASYTSIVKGPDGKMYAGSISGEIYRFDIQPDGKLANRQTISTVRTYSNSGASGDTYRQGTRTVIGLAFDPASTADNLILWISDNAPYLGASDVPDSSGRIAKLTGANLQNYTAIVDGLPRSVKDHEANSVAFGPDGALYLNVGANNAMGAPDGAWANRAERLLSAAVLRLDPAKLPAAGQLPVNVRTGDAGSYDPFAPDAPLTLHATGVRNAYDLVWHSNGHLYVPTNGSAAGGNVPEVPDTLPAVCAKRPDGGYSGPKVLGQTNNPEETDYVFDIKKGKYYGHPNPSRCEYVLNNGNPTAAKDPFENSKYPVGTQPDPNYALSDVYDAGLHASANGVIEYTNTAFGGALKGKLLYVRYSSGRDIVSFDVASDGRLSNRKEALSGTTNLQQPLDLTEDPSTGNIYVTQLTDNPGTTSIALLKPQGGGGGPAATASSRLVLSGPTNATSPTANATVTNTGLETVTIPSGGLSLAGADAAHFTITSPNNAPTMIAPGASAQVGVAFRPTSTGVKTATLLIATDAGPKTVALRGLAAAGLGGGNEPSLQRIMETLQIPIDVGDPNPNDASMPSTQGPIGDEVSAQLFQKAAFDTPISITPLAAYGPQNNNPAVHVGWYDAGQPASLHRQFSISAAEVQGLMINPDGATTNIDPGEEAVFGLYSEWPYFGGRKAYTEDALNTWDSALPHHVRVYPYKNADGTVEPNAYVAATEEVPGSPFDSQDIVLLVKNVKPYVPAEAEGAVLRAVNPDPVPFEDQIAFNRIQSPADGNQKVADTGIVRITNPGTAPYQVTGLPITDTFELVNAPSLPLTVAPGQTVDLTVKFTATSTKVHNGTLTVQSNAETNPTQVIHLGGLWQSVSEGGQEPNLSQIAKAFGLGTNIPNGFTSKGEYAPIGDEVLSPYWARVDPAKPVTVRQMAAFHTYPNGASVKLGNKGSNPSDIHGMGGNYAQSLLPRINNSAGAAPAGGSRNPVADGNAAKTHFEFAVDGERGDHTKNDAGPDLANGCVAPCGQHVRLWPVKDRAGALVPGSYLMSMDYSGINYDYQDNVYLVTNIRPEVITAPQVVATPGNNAVTLSWNRNPYDVGVGYRVWRGTTPDFAINDAALISGPTSAEPLSATTFTDTNVTNGTTYYYVVRAVYKGVNNSEDGTASTTPTASAQNVDVKVNFSNEAATLPTGYLRDFGQAFGPRTRADQGTGLTYGWIGETTLQPLDLSVGGTTGPGNGRWRMSSQADLRLDTFMHMQADDVPSFNGTPVAGGWELAVPNGTYEVTLAVGDPSVNSDPEVHGVSVEGVAAIDGFLPSGGAGSAARHKTATVEVAVVDGRLTVMPTGTNTKIDYLDVVTAD